MNLQAESISREDFEQWLNAQAIERKWALATRNRYIALLKLTYRRAEEDGKIVTNPVRLLKMRNEASNARIRYLNEHKPLPTEIGYLQDCSDEESRLRAVITAEYLGHLAEVEIALHTGMRKSEQYGLRWVDVDFARKVIRIRESKHGDPRPVYPNSTVMSMLEFLRTKAGHSEHVFCE